MAKMIEVTKAGGTLLQDEDVKISVNADNINILEPINNDDYVGNTIIRFNDGTYVNVIETRQEIVAIIEK